MTFPKKCGIIIEIIKNHEGNVKKLGKIDVLLLEIEFGKLATDEVVLTDERLEHILLRHHEDYMLFKKHIHEILADPDIIIKDRKNEATVLFIKIFENLNINTVIRLSLEKEKNSRENSIITFYRIRDRILKNLKIHNKIILDKTE